MAEKELNDGWSEDELHRWLAQQSWPRGLAGSRGHDAAVLETLPGRPAICADQCIEGVHFLREVGGEAAGQKAVLRTLSDLAATAARPTAVTLTLKASTDVPMGWICAALTGAQRAAAAFGAELVAGDLAACAGPIAISVTALGSVAGEAVPVGRDRAEVGQVVLLSGAVGGSLPSGRHLAPAPRIEEGIAMAAAGATAMMDVSDGLAWDLYRLGRASDCVLRIDAHSIPIHDDARAASRPGEDPLLRALHDGEDHELIATIGREAWDRFGPGLSHGNWVEIGQVLEKPLGAASFLLVHRDEEELPWCPEDSGGWTYGKRRGE